MLLPIPGQLCDDKLDDSLHASDTLDAGQLVDENTDGGDENDEDDDDVHDENNDVDEDENPQGGDVVLEGWNNEGGQVEELNSGDIDESNSGDKAEEKGEEEGGAVWQVSSVSIKSVGLSQSRRSAGGCLEHTILYKIC